MQRWLAIIYLIGVQFFCQPLSHAQDKGADQHGDSQTPNISETGGNENPPEFTINILVVDIARVRSTALAYQSIQHETERVRDLVNSIYQERLEDLEQARDDLQITAQELQTVEEPQTAKELQTAISDLERSAVDLENKRRQNFANLERRRQEASSIADIQLNAVLASLLHQFEASYIINQQSALVWPDAANVTDQAIELLDQILPSVSFNTNFDPEEG